MPNPASLDDPVPGGVEITIKPSLEAPASRLADFLQKYAEISFIVIILIVVSGLFHWIPYKIAFLNFFYLPVLATGYLLGARRAVLSSVLCSLVVLVYYLWQWTSGALLTGAGIQELPAVIAQNWEILFQLAMWSGFLILVGGAFGRVNERVMKSYTTVQELDKGLRLQAKELRDLNTALQTSSKELGRKAEELQRISSTMDATVARLIVQGRLREEKRTLSVLFCDLKGFTAYSQGCSPEIILDDLNNFYEAMEEIVDAYHGHVDKYMGDGIMCVFGAPIDQQQHSLQAAVAALKMQEKFQSSQFPWQLRVGVASGDAIVGLFGSRRRTYSALGSTVNLAKRLEELCQAGSVYVDENTRAHIQPSLDYERVYSLFGQRERDKKNLEQIAEKEKLLEADPKSADLLFEIGQFCLQAREGTRALGYLRRALELRPDDTEIKLAYAEANLKRDDFEKIAIRGIDQKQAVFRLTAMKDPTQDRKRFPGTLYERFRSVPGRVAILDDIVLPVEVIDGALGHSLCVAALSYAIADHMGLPEDAGYDIMTAARLQDIGKSVLPPDLLNRQGGLNEQQRQELERHVIESGMRARAVGYDKPSILEIIANHHEWLDGSGYPRRASGDEIPLGARITCVADVYCALTAWRPYREAWESRAAMGELRRGAKLGRFDPKVVDAVSELSA